MNMTALNEALTSEVQRLKLATTDLNGESRPSKGMINPQRFQLQQQSPQTQFNMQQHQQQQQQQHQQQQQQQQQHQQHQQQQTPQQLQQNGSTTSKPESNQ